jgi:GNAT superfamily N-acetyltransferase
VITITAAGRGDASAVAALLEELDRYYGAREFGPAEERTRLIDSVLFRDLPAAHVLLARDGSRALGLAAYSFLWPAAGITQSLYLKELYVVEQYRKLGLGRALIGRLCQVAIDNACSRIEWTTDRDNLDAQQFYETLGVSTNTAKVFYRIEDDDILRLVS